MYTVYMDRLSIKGSAYRQWCHVIHMHKKVNSKEVFHARCDGMYCLPNNEGHWDINAWCSKVEGRGSIFYGLNVYPRLACICIL